MQSVSLLYLPASHSSRLASRRKHLGHFSSSLRMNVSKGSILVSSSVRSDGGLLQRLATSTHPLCLSYNFRTNPPCWDISRSTWALYDLKRTARILRVTTEEQNSTPLLLQAIFVLPNTACISSMVAFHYQTPTKNLACDYSSTARSKQVLRPASRSPNCKPGPAFLSTSGIAGDTSCRSDSIVTAP